MAAHYLHQSNSYGKESNKVNDSQQSAEFFNQLKGMSGMSPEMLNIGLNAGKAG
jgi:hypothetical protein